MKVFLLYSRNVVLLIFSIFLFSCEKDNPLPSVNKDKVTGYVQKGPYISGTALVMYELNENLEQTGKSFTTSITDEKGTFQFNNIALNSPYVLVTANGYYFNENTGQLSSSTLQLNALLDIKDVSAINVNILTHLEKPRVEYLIGQGKTFAEAKKIAQQEIFEMLNFPVADVQSSESLDISKTGDGNAMLLAASVIIQGQLPVADLTQFLAALSLDLQQDGELTNSTQLETLRNNALGLYPQDIRDNLTARYNVLDAGASIPVYEDYLHAFLGTFVNVPLVSTGNLKIPYANEAVLGGFDIFSDGGAYVREYGIVYSTNPNPSILNNKSRQFTCCEFVVFGLSPSTKYYARFYGTNIYGTGYGEQFEFTTKATNLNTSLTYGTVSDIDGNTYATIDIGTQTWMAENLKVSHYLNGDVIPYVQDFYDWLITTTGAYGIYDNKPENNSAYGKLYNGYAVADIRGICPSGWHIPSEGEWIILRDFIGWRGDKLKAGYDLYSASDSINLSGFTGLSGGYLNNGGTGFGIGQQGYWWSSSISNYNNPQTLKFFLLNWLGGGGGVIIEDLLKNYGASIRCIKD